MYSFIKNYFFQLSLIIILFFISLLLFYKTLDFGFIYDDSYLLWAAKYHPEYFGIYWGHPATVLEFITLYKVFGLQSRVFMLVGILLRTLCGFTGYLFLTKLTGSRKLGIFFSLLFVTSFVGIQPTTWSSVHVVLIDLIALLLTCYSYCNYLIERSVKQFIIFVFFFSFAIACDPGRAFPFVVFLILLFFVDKYMHTKKSIFTRKELWQFTIIISMSITIFVIWRIFSDTAFGGALGRPHKRIPFETVKYFLARLLMYILIRTSEHQSFLYKALTYLKPLPQESDFHFFSYGSTLYYVF